MHQQNPPALQDGMGHASFSEPLVYDMTADDDEAIDFFPAGESDTCNTSSRGRVSKRDCSTPMVTDIGTNPDNMEVQIPNINIMGQNVCTSHIQIAEKHEVAQHLSAISNSLEMLSSFVPQIDWVPIFVKLSKSHQQEVIRRIENRRKISYKRKPSIEMVDVKGTLQPYPFVDMHEELSQAYSQEESVGVPQDQDMEKISETSQMLQMPYCIYMPKPESKDEDLSEAYSQETSVGVPQDQEMEKISKISQMLQMPYRIYMPKPEIKVCIKQTVKRKIQYPHCGVADGQQLRQQNVLLHVNAPVFNKHPMLNSCFHDWSYSGRLNVSTSSNSQNGRKIGSGCFVDHSYVSSAMGHSTSHRHLQTQRVHPARNIQQKYSNISHCPAILPKRLTHCRSEPIMTPRIHTSRSSNSGRLPPMEPAISSIQ